MDIFPTFVIVKTTLTMRTILYLLSSLFILFNASLAVAGKEKRIDVSDYGLLPDLKVNSTVTVRKILKELSADKSISGAETVISFAKGRYDFYPDSVLQYGTGKTVAFDIDALDGIIIEGDSSSFVFHGRMIPFRIVSSSDITLKGFSIDWERPYNIQAEVAGVGADFIDLRIDPEVYPFDVIDGRIVGVGEYGLQYIEKAYTCLYNPDTYDILYRTRDLALGKALYDSDVERLSEDTVRVHCMPEFVPPAGTVVLFHLARYLANGIEIFNSSDIRIEDIDIFHTLSCGIYGVRVDNIFMDGMDIIADHSRGRVFSTIADATHFIGCTGTVHFRNCIFSGAGDDCTNVHNMYAPVEKIVGSNSLIVSPTGRDCGFLPGEKAWILDTADMQRSKAYTVSSVRKMEGSRNYMLEFKESLEDNVREGNILENATAFPDVTVEGCRFMKQNRARGVLVTTPGKVRIKGNYFNSAGAAILIEGDTRLWYESGAVSDVLIKNNVFENCYTSGDNITDYPWGWGEAPVTVTPSILPDSLHDEPYHRNIRIRDNVFMQFDYPILYARSVDGISFVRNSVKRTYDYKPYYRKYNFVFDGCRKVRFSANGFSDDFLGKNINIIHMDPSEIMQRKMEKLKID